jgi:hypothetical protein
VLGWRHGMASLVPGTGWCGRDASKALCASTTRWAVVYLKRGAGRVAVSGPWSKAKAIRAWTFQPASGSFVNDAGVLLTAMFLQCPAADCVVVLAPV